MAIEKELKNLNLNRPAQKGFDYKEWPIIKPVYGKKDFEIVNAHWEYVPAFVHNEFELQEYRKRYTWLNAMAEHLFVNESGKPSVYKEGALHGRCLILSSGFYEYRHIPKLGKKGQELKEKEKIPYRITLADDPELFFMAGVSRLWTNENRNESAETFAIVTTKANNLMEQVHNSKKRMPTILPEALAYEWLFGDLDQKRISEIGSYQYDSEEMIAYPVSKDFMKAFDPSVEQVYENLPAIL